MSRKKYCTNIQLLIICRMKEIAHGRTRQSLNTEKAKALQAALAQIEKQFGKGSIMRLGDGEKIEDIQVVSTGSLGLDIALGVGGLPRGRVIEIYGPESSGKTTLTLQVIAEMQKLGGTCAFIDAEHALDIQYAQKLGVNLQELLISQPDTGEQALEIVDALVRSGSVDLIVIDSVAALTPKAELEGEMGDSLPGLQARLMSQALRKLTATIKKTNTMVIFINQIRMKIGVMFGNPETTTGGNALKFYASVRDWTSAAPARSSRRAKSRHRQRDQGQGRQEQGRESAVQDRRVRHPLRRRHQPRGRDHRHGRRSTNSPASSTSPAPGTPTTARRSARARTTRASSCARTPTAREIENKVREAPVGIPRQTLAPRRAAMKIHEYQGKEILRHEDPRIPGVPRVPRGYPPSPCAKPTEAAQKLGGPVWVVKAQIHAGGRGKGGGVKVAKLAGRGQGAGRPDPGHAAQDAPDRPRGPEGAPPATSRKAPTSRRSTTSPRSPTAQTQKVAIMASSEGGMDIEEVAHRRPRRSSRSSSTRWRPDRRAGAGARRGIGVPEGSQAAGDGRVPEAVPCYMETDASLAEINPLILRQARATSRRWTRSSTSTPTRCSATPRSWPTATSTRKTRPRSRPASSTWPTSAWTATSAAWSTAPAWRWRRWTPSSCSAASRPTSWTSAVAPPPRR
jgi:protein RecA